MTNTKLFLLIGTSLSLIPQTINAQCVATQDCATLGYTETSCSGGSGVKCPFGNKWACFKSESEFCNEYGFTLSCNDTNQTGGGSKACNGKYNYCTCADGYIWQNGACKSSEPDYSACTIGALFYSDNTCSNEFISSKTLLGIVIYEKTASANGWIITHKPIATNIVWGGYGTDISGLTNYSSETYLTDIQASCTNTNIITSYGNSSTYPAAWAAKNYSPSGTPSGKSWCLPSGGLLNTALNNSANFTKFNAAVYKIQAYAGTSAATILGNVSNEYERVWSSSEYSSYFAWTFAAYRNGSLTMYDGYYKYDSGSYRSVRPVLAF